MPRNHIPGTSTLRNRVRITNKTRLKIHHGNLESDPLLILDEDEEKHHFNNLVAGVDAEDAQEHHLQAVLSASQRPQIRSTRADEKEQNSAYIPTPDSTGVVDNYTDLYPSDRWKDPSTYLCTSSTVEELCRDGLADGFTYYMDERDKEWLDKNNEEGRGEGTSTQGAVTASTNRAGARSAKAKGKEPEALQLPVISEEEFELVMGLFEKVTHERTEYLHHGLENGMAFPAFTDYQESFSSPLVAPTFADHVIPSWVPPPEQLVRIAQTIYPYWKERRVERCGHRIIPALNYDESDLPNESYVCFRRRETKAIRKTRASQASSSDKLLRLQQELAYPLDLAKVILSRENQKKHNLQHAQQVWQRRMEFADLKRKYPSLNDKGDEDLLIDREKPKKADTSNRPTKVKTEQGPARPEGYIRPRDRTALISEAVESTLSRQKDRDYHWEDQIDSPHQTPSIPYPGRLFKYVPVNFTPSEVDGRPVPQRRSRALRLRRGRGGRMMVDRHDLFQPRMGSTNRPRLLDSGDSDVEMEDGDRERGKNLSERWRFDADDVSAGVPEDIEDPKRMLVDDYSEKYLRHSMTLLSDADQQHLVTDPSIPIVVDGKQQHVVPFRLGMPLQAIRRESVHPLPSQVLPHPASLPVSASSNTTPVAAPRQLKRLSVSGTTTPLHMRIPSNGSVVTPSATSQTLPPSSATALQHPLPTTNGINRAAINIAHVDVAKPEATMGHSVHVPATENSVSQDPKANGANGMPAKPNALHSGLSLNGYNFNQLANASPNAVALAQLAPQGQALLTPQQIQSLKNVLAHSSQFTQGYVPPASAIFNFQDLTAGANGNIKLPAARQMQQWLVAAAAAPKPAVVPNGIADPIAIPARVPSANGVRTNGIHGPSVSPSATATLAQAQSPPRVPVNPTLTKASPSVQHQQSTNSKSGY